MTMTIDDMSARYADDKMKAAAKKIPPYIVSSDDHVYEPAELWDSLPQNLRSQISRPPSDDELDKKLRPRGGRHPKERLPDMDHDGISACVLYPSFALRLFGYPIAPVVVGLILGPMAEIQFRRAVQISQGDLMVFLERPISAALLAIAVLALVLPALLRRRQR